MVNAWNNVEKESILKFAPKYFDHMKKTDEVKKWTYCANQFVLTIHQALLNLYDDY